MSYGLNANVSIVKNDGDYEIGVHVTDSKGLDCSSHVLTDDPVEGITSLLNEVKEDIVNQSTASEEEFDDDGGYSEEEYIEYLEKELESLEIDNQILEKRLQDLMDKQSTGKEKKVAKSDKVNKTYRNMLSIENDIINQMLSNLKY